VIPNLELTIYIKSEKSSSRGEGWLGCRANEKNAAELDVVQRAALGDARRRQPNAMYSLTLLLGLKRSTSARVNLGETDKFLGVGWLCRHLASISILGHHKAS